MVFENVTLFEVHLDDAQFNAETGTGSSTDAADAVDVRRSDRAGHDRVDAEPADASEAGDSEESSGSGRGRFAKLALASVLVSVAATVVARRMAGGDDDPVAVGLEEDEGVEYGGEADTVEGTPSGSTGAREE